MHGTRADTPDRLSLWATVWRGRREVCGRWWVAAGFQVRARTVRCTVRVQRPARPVPLSRDRWRVRARLDSPGPPVF